MCVSEMVPPDLRFEALLHDASEAYCNDISRPLKASLPDYRRVESLNSQAVRQRFGLPMEHHPDVKCADNDILQSEYRELMNVPTPVDCPGKFRAGIHIRGYVPALAERLFLERFYYLYKGV